MPASYGLIRANCIGAEHFAQAGFWTMPGMIGIGAVAGTAMLLCYRREHYRTLSHRRLWERAAAGDNPSVRLTRMNSESFN
jgi:hypothetical protein